MNDKVAAVVVSYNRKKILTECVNAILNQSLRVSSIYIIENASTDGTLVYFCEFFNLRYQQEVKKLNYYYSKYLIRGIMIKYIRMVENIGGSGGFNLGMKLAYYRHEYVWIMDDDVIPQYDSLEYLVQGYKFVPEAVFLASNVVSESGFFMNVPAIDNRNEPGKYLNWNKYLKYGYVGIISATFVSLLFPKETILKIGLPIKEFFIWGDDTEYTLRATEKDVAYLVGNSVVVHRRKTEGVLSLIEEDDINRLKMYEYFYRNSYYCLKKYHGKLGIMKYLAKILIAAFEVFRKSENRKFLRIKVLLEGFWKGLYFNPSIERVK